MGKICAILGPSGDGKTTSTVINPDGSYDFSKEGYKGMNPETHIIINLDMKELPFPSGMWSKENRNYVETDNMTEIRSALQEISKMQHVKSVSLDTINLFLAYKEFNDRKKMTFDQWTDLANDIIEINRLCNTVLRDDQIAYIFGHVEMITDVDGSEKLVMAVSGKKARKQMPEGFYSIVLFSSKEVKSTGEVSYVFRSKSGKSSAKAPIGMFEKDTIPNSLKLVDDTIRKYYNI